MSGEISTTNGNGAEPQKRNPPRPSVIVRVFRYLKRRNNRRHQAEKKQTDRQRNELVMARWTRRVGIFTIVIAVISGISAWIFYGQQNIMQGQLDEMGKQRLMTIAQLRADLKQESPQITPIRSDEKPAQPGDSVVAWAVSPQWINSGETDARGYIGWFDLKPLTFTKPHHVSAADCPVPTRTPTKPTDIPRGQGFRMVAKKIELPNAERAEGGYGIILMVGHLEYRDIFPGTTEHHADWCTALLPNDLKQGLWSPFILFQTSD